MVWKEVVEDIFQRGSDEDNINARPPEADPGHRVIYEVPDNFCVRPQPLRAVFENFYTGVCIAEATLAAFLTDIP